ncbi:MAG: 50S ribosomal protein L6 [Candidatus Omnitrophica bacterium]|nr:50S ribosomal protein L6 [Candidatus Omnitrophota bacterium]
MSRIGKNPIAIPKEVKITVKDGRCLVEAAKHKLELSIPFGITVEVNEGFTTIKRVNDSKQVRSLHGTIRMLVSNMVDGVTKGFKKELDIVGVGYKAQIKGKQLVLNVGFSHSVDMEIPEGLKVSCAGNNKIIVEGIDKQRVGEFTAKVRKIYPPEPYKGKGIRYSGEKVRKKLGKALAK